MAARECRGPRVKRWSHLCTRLSHWNLDPWCAGSPFHDARVHVYGTCAHVECLRQDLDTVASHDAGAMQSRLSSGKCATMIMWPSIVRRSTRCTRSSRLCPEKLLCPWTHMLRSCRGRGKARESKEILTFAPTPNPQLLAQVVLGVKDSKELLKFAQKLTDAGFRHRVWVEQPENDPTALVCALRGVVCPLCVCPFCEYALRGVVCPSRVPRASCLGVARFTLLAFSTRFRVHVCVCVCVPCLFVVSSHDSEARTQTQAVLPYPRGQIQPILKKLPLLK